MKRSLILAFFLIASAPAFADQAAPGPTLDAAFRDQLGDLTYSLTVARFQAQIAAARAADLQKQLDAAQAQIKDLQAQLAAKATPYDPVK